MRRFSHCFDTRISAWITSNIGCLVFRNCELVQTNMLLLAYLRLEKKKKIDITLSIGHSEPVLSTSYFSSSTTFLKSFPLTVSSVGVFVYWLNICIGGIKFSRPCICIISPAYPLNPLFINILSLKRSMDFSALICGVDIFPGLLSSMEDTLFLLATCWNQAS